MDLSHFEETPPSISMVESVRNFGYNLNTAVSDLIDNSITAGANEIKITLLFEKKEPCVIIHDNGIGMTDIELSKNMTLGSRDPTAEQCGGDLGRFGLGLKTASFALCRQLNVFSKSADHKIAYRGWDLDMIKTSNRWLVSKELPQWYGLLEDEFQLGTSGTLVVWKKCDRLKKLFTNVTKMEEMGTDLQSHIGTFFCRFLKGSRKICIMVNDNKILPWDPIPEGSRSMAEQSIGNIKIHPYVLPKKDAFEDLAKFDKASGIKGWNAQQGFYVYRNNRLIVNGGWLNLKKMKIDEHTKLARIIIDIDSSADESWNIDVSKSKANLPMGSSFTPRSRSSSVMQQRSY